MKDKATKGFNRVLLVNPETGSKLGGIRPHSGLGYLEKYLTGRGIECRVFDMRLGHSYGELLGAAREMDADLIGFSLYSFGYKRSYALIEKTKQDLSGVAVVAGGPHISSFLTDALRGCPAIDYGV
ncbi:MAG: cobalamin-dependent protein, partial [Thermodesulfobacteriota bacterium]